MPFYLSGLSRSVLFPRPPTIHTFPQPADGRLTDGCDIREFLIFKDPPAGDFRPSTCDLLHLFLWGEAFYKNRGRKTLTR